MKKKLRIQKKITTGEQFALLVKRANTGDPDALRRLRQTLDERPGIWRSIGDLAHNAELAIIRLISGKDVLLRESLQRSLEVLRADISPSDPSPLEKLLISRVLNTWMQVQYVETNYASLSELSLLEKKFALQQRESAQKLFDAAVKSLRTAQSKLGQLPGPAATPKQLKIKSSRSDLRVVRAAV